VSELRIQGWVNPLSTYDFWGQKKRYGEKPKEPPLTEGLAGREVRRRGGLRRQRVLIESQSRRKSLIEDGVSKSLVWSRAWREQLKKALSLGGVKGGGRFPEGSGLRTPECEPTRAVAVCRGVPRDSDGNGQDTERFTKWEQREKTDGRGCRGLRPDGKSLAGGGVVGGGGWVWVVWVWGGGWGGEFGESGHVGKRMKILRVEKGKEGGETTSV